MSKSDEKTNDKPDSNEGQHNKLTIQVRYQSETVEVSTNVNASVTSLLEKAMIETQNNSVSKDRFQLKFGSTVLDPHKKIGDYPIGNGALLVLSLLAGGGGDHSFC